jgi:mannose-1-phosphate guanylyltransferase
VTAFVEKPDGEGARFLLGRGALLNSLILVATGQALLGLFDRAMPQLVGRFVSWIEETGAGAEALGELYRDLSPRDFSRSVLERWYDALSVIRTPDCGWTDVGTPSRLGRVRSRRSTRGVGDARLVCRA